MVSSSSNRSISFIGRSGGDMECFCWFVSADEYIKICGREAYDMEVEYMNEMDMEPEEKVWRIYPSDLISYEGDASLRKYTVIVERLED